MSFLFFFSATGHNPKIPKEYKAIKEITGDLDNDSFAEKVVVYNMTDIAILNNDVKNCFPFNLYFICFFFSDN